MKIFRALVFTLAVATSPVFTTKTKEISKDKANSISKDIAAFSEVCRYGSRVQCIKNHKIGIIIGGLGSLIHCGEIVECFPTIKKSLFKRSIEYKDGATVAQGITAFLYMCAKIANSVEKYIKWKPKTPKELSDAASKIKGLSPTFTFAFSPKDLPAFGIVFGKFTKFSFVNKKMTALLSNIGSSLMALPDAGSIFTNLSTSTLIQKFHIFAASLYVGSSFTHGLHKYHAIAKSEAELDTMSSLDDKKEI